MKIYFDSCSLQRPLDDQSQIRIATETEAILGVLSLWESGKLDLIGSEVLEYEASLISQFERVAYVSEIFRKLKMFVILNESIEKRALFFVEKGARPLDALHLACAEDANADFFCTSDDKLLRKAKSIRGVKIPVISPLELITRLDL